jgi:hypothetical protein
MKTENTRDNINPTGSNDSCGAGTPPCTAAESLHRPSSLCLWGGILLLLHLSCLQAQDDDRHEISFYGMSGKWSRWQYFNAGAGADYTFFLNHRWGLTAGIELTTSSMTVAIEDITGAVAGWYYHEDGRQEVTETLFATDGLAVSPHITYVNLPLLLQFRTGVRHKFYTSAGVKAGFAQAGNYRITAESIRTEGYFPASGQTFANMSNHSFVTVSRPSMRSRLKQNFNYALLWEGGMRWRLKSGLFVYTGVYFDYGFPDIAPKRITVPIEDIKNVLPEEVLHNPEYMQMIEERTTVDVDRVNLVAAGIKIKLAFGLSPQPR